jgi:hypothetical protein
MGYSVNISPSVGSPSFASGSYNISSENPIMISPNNDDPATGLLIGVNAVRPE